jgi:hypothetical protein
LMWDKQKSGIDEVKLVIGYRAVWILPFDE